jgi:hypothetical protein
MNCEDKWKNYTKKKKIDDVKLVDETSGEKLFKICGFIYCLLDVKQVDAEYITILIKLN